MQAFGLALAVVYCKAYFVQSFSENIFEIEYLRKQPAVGFLYFLLNVASYRLRLRYKSAVFIRLFGAERNLILESLNFNVLQQIQGKIFLCLRSHISSSGIM